MIPAGQEETYFDKFYTMELVEENGKMVYKAIPKQETNDNIKKQ